MKIDFPEINDISISVDEAAYFLGYGKLHKPEEPILSMINSSIVQMKNVVKPKACAEFFDLKVEGELIQFADLKFTSKDLSKNLKNCSKIVLAAVTVGSQADFLIRKAQIQDSAKSSIMQAVGAAFAALVDSVKAWNNEEKRRWVNDFIFKQTKYYHDFRGLQKVMLQMMPSEPYVGEPVAVVREKSDEDLLMERKLKREEQQRLEAEKEARLVIPLNEDYETRIFASSNVGWDCDLISYLMHEENDRIKALANRGEYQEAALRFMQLAKSMCRHFISDEHYCYFDDLYSPEYAIDDLVNPF